MSLTDAQRRAIGMLAGDVAIRAGAGSGKTTVLALRFAEALKPLEPGGQPAASIDGILTITFTKKAAAEIAERVRRVVERDVGADVARRIDEAWISTFHQMCGRLVRRHSLEAGIDPGSRVADEAQAHLLQADAFDAVLKEHAGSDQIGALIERFSAIQIRDAVLAAHGRIRSLGLRPQDAVAPSGWSERTRLAHDVVTAGEAYLAAVGECSPSASRDQRLAGFSEYLERLRDATQEGNARADELLALTEEYSMTAHPNCREPHDVFKDRLRVLGWVVYAELSASLLEAILTLLRSFDAEYRSAKQRLGVLDFDDLQEVALRLLGTDPVISERYRRQFGLIMVDEFQDTNGLQMQVLKPLRADNLAIVGDERQSIYGFRDADVSIFIDEVNSVPSEQQVELRENFRSEEPILRFTNAFFGRPDMFGAGFMALEPARVRESEVALPADAPRVEAILADYDAGGVEAGRRAEATEIARRIHELREAGNDPSKIVVLLRSGTQATIYAEALVAEGVPVYVAAGASLFRAPEVQEMLALIRCIALPDDDEALALVLAGRLGGLSDDGLLALRLSAPRESLWTALTAVASGGDGCARLSACDARIAAHTWRAIGELRRMHGTTPLEEVVRRGVELFDYDLTLASLGLSGERALANVRKIVRLAEEYERVEAADAGTLWRRLREREECGSDDREVPVETSGGGAVRIMTIHSAKGLEFPIVFVADLASGTDKGTKDLFLVGKSDAGGGRVAPSIGVKFPLLGPHSPSKKHPRTLEYERLCDEEQRLGREEEMRVLYVACTRAEELLVLSGARKSGSDAGDSQLLDWVRATLGDPAESGVVDVAGTPVAVTVLEAAEEAARPPAVKWREADDLACSPEVEPLQPREARPIPRQLSYSTLHRWDECRLAFYLGEMLGLRAGVDVEGAVAVQSPETEGASQGGGRAASATEFGSAFHEVMYAIPPEGDADAVLESVSRRCRLMDPEHERLGSAVARTLERPSVREALDAEKSRREQAFRVPLGDGVSLVGALDLIAWEGSRALVIDYKTGLAPTAAPDDRSAAYRLQAECYALAAFRSGGEEVEVVFVFAESDEEVRFRFPEPSIAEEIASAIAARVEEMRAGEITRLPRYEQVACAECPALGGLCPVDAPGRAGAS